ncbi:uncharacterized protein si:ch211-243a20.3 [Brachionichthys hirsutus]|uniref:uncharacterized protein si:ch211-243a20.3 n=1 Tax=Brachionichthys hirsutus TaxID=412623 RepID=UPI003604AFCB
MAQCSLLMALMAVAMATGARSASEENEPDYGYWNYREGADSVNVAPVRSVTRVLDAWGKSIFNEIKTLLHSQPNTLLPDYSRVHPLSESVSDLFREASLLRRRVTELAHRLAILEPFLRHYGYREGEEEEEKEKEKEEGADNGEMAGGFQSQRTRGEAVSRTRHHNPGAAGRASRVVRRRRVRVLNNGVLRKRGTH